MTGIYGHRWTGSYGDTPAREWVMAVDGLSADQVKRGLNHLIADPKKWAWPPNAIEFRGLCMPSAEELGLLGESDAFQQAIRHNTDTRPRAPEVIFTLRAMGDDAYKMKHSDTEKAQKMFSKYWRSTVEHVVAGGVFPEPEKRIEKKEKLATRKQNLAGVANLKEMFK